MPSPTPSHLLHWLQSCPLFSKSFLETSFAKESSKIPPQSAQVSAVLRSLADICWPMDLLFLYSCTSTSAFLGLNTCTDTDAFCRRGYLQTWHKNPGGLDPGPQNSLQVPKSTTQYSVQSLRILPKLSGLLYLPSRNESCVTDRASDKSEVNFCARVCWFLQSRVYRTVFTHHLQTGEKL